MIIDCIADLHGDYPELEGGDLLIVAGDLTGSDQLVQYNQFFDWIHEQEYKKIIWIAGNHDNWVQKQVTQWYAKSPDLGIDIEYLCDSGTEFEYEENAVVEPNPLAWMASIHKIKPKKKLKIWGSPWTNTFVGINPHCTAFTGTEELLATKFALIPSDTDILITHGPPYCILDTVRKRHNDKWESVGSVSLLKELDRIRPKLHVYGHIHEGYGQYRPTLDLGFQEPLPGYPIFVNCSHVDGDYEPVNKPIRVIL